MDYPWHNAVHTERMSSKTAAASRAQEVFRLIQRGELIGGMDPADAAGIGSREPSADGVAWNDALSRRSYWQFCRRSAALVACGVALWAVAFAVLALYDYPDTGAASGIVTLLLGVGCVPFGGGLLALVNAVRMRRCMRRNAWQQWPTQYAEVTLGGTPNGQPTLVLGANREHVLTVVAFNWRWRLISGAQSVYLAGKPDRGGVVCAEPGKPLLWVRRPRMLGRTLRRRIA